MLMTARMSTRDVLEQLVAERVLLLDGSMGALIFSREPKEEDYRGSRFRQHPCSLKNCIDVLVLSQPEMIEGIHRAYLEAGSDIIETCTFNASRLALEEFALTDYVAEINKKAVQIARRAADDFTRRNPDKPRFVAGSMGPTGKTLYIEPGNPNLASRNVSFDDFVASYYAQVEGLVAGGVDLITAETGNDILVLKACLFAIDRYCADRGVDLPAIVSGTIYHPGGRTLFSQTPEAFFVAISHFDALSVGFNCGVGVEMLRSPVESLAQLSRKLVAGKSPVAASKTFPPQKARRK